MKVTQVSIGRFHHFHLARQLEKRRLLDVIYTGYPKFKLKDETGIPLEKIKSYPWFHTPYMARGKFGLNRWDWLNKEWAWHAHDSLDKYVASKINYATVLVALSGSGHRAGKQSQELGGVYICDRGSSHIIYQNELLKEEYDRWGLKFNGIDSRAVEKEQEQYYQADIITVPSEYVRRSFLEKGVDQRKVKKIAYGVRLERFGKIDNVPTDRFRVLWVGAVGVRKGFMDLIRAFELFRHPRKELVVIGNVLDEMKSLLRAKRLANVFFKGTLPNVELPKYYSTSHVFVLPSLEEGLAMVQGEALACGCPVVASTNTGAEDLFTSGVEGFIVPIRSPKSISERLEILAGDSELRQKMSQAALKRVQQIKGWDGYGDEFASLVAQLQK